MTMLEIALVCVQLVALSVAILVVAFVATDTVIAVAVGALLAVWGVLVLYAAARVVRERTENTHYAYCAVVNIFVATLSLAAIVLPLCTPNPIVAIGTWIVVAIAWRANARALGAAVPREQP